MVGLIGLFHRNGFPSIVQRGVFYMLGNVDDRGMLTRSIPWATFSGVCQVKSAPIRSGPWVIDIACEERRTAVVTLRFPSGSPSGPGSR